MEKDYKRWSTFVWDSASQAYVPAYLENENIVLWNKLDEGNRS